MSDGPHIPDDLRFAIKPKTARDGTDYVMWAVMRAGEATPFLVVASETEDAARNEFNTWLIVHKHNPNEHRAAIDALWSFKFREAA